MKFLLIFVAFLAPFNSALGLISPEDIKGEEIQITTIKQTKGKSNTELYQLNITTGDNQNIPLNLKHLDKSIFSTGFTFGASTWDNFILADIERDIYVDYSQNTILQISSETQFVKGYSQGKLINHGSNGKHFMYKGSDAGCGVTSEHDVHEPEFDSNTSKNKDEQQTNDSTNAESMIEVVAVFDRTLYSALGNSELEALKYGAMMFHVVNIIYSNMVTPTLEVKLAGVRILTQAEDATIVQNTNHNIYQMLPAFRTWLSSNPSGVGPNDVAALVTGVLTLDNEGSSRVAGLAYVGTTCGTYKVSVSRDVGAIFDGIIAVAHEIGHNMGARHDFDTTCGSEGYIMDYYHQTSNLYGFSACSKQTIRDRMNTVAGHCLLQENAGPGIGIGPAPGQGLSMEEQCKLKIEAGNYGTYTGYSPQANPAEQCLKLTCKFRKPDNSNRIITFRYPLEGTPCNSSGGKCNKGHCV